jgi:hypothetical protein
MTLRPIHHLRVSAAGLALGLLLAAGPLRAAGLVAAFDWSMPARFAVPDPPEPEGAYEVYVDGDLHPATWRVDFDACASAGAIAEYRWSIDGAPAARNAAAAVYAERAAEFDLTSSEIDAVLAASGLAARGLAGTPLHLTGYPDITHDEQGASCGWSAGDDGHRAARARAAQAMTLRRDAGARPRGDSEPP